MYDAVAVGELLIDLTSIGTNDDGYPTLSAHTRRRARQLSGRDEQAGV